MIAITVYLLNLSLTKAVRDQTPYEACQERKTRVSHLKVFGCITYALHENRSKLDEKSQKCIFFVIVQNLKHISYIIHYVVKLSLVEMSSLMKKTGGNRVLLTMRQKL